jgi:formylglycine-generating enzyme required for sulfatase activity
MRQLNFPVFLPFLPAQTAAGMKRKAAGFGGIVFSLLILVGFSSCIFLMGPDEPEDSEGSLVISLGAGAERAISSGADLPGDVLATLRYELTLTGPGGEVLNRSVTGGEALNLTVSLGEWRIAARAYKENGLAGTGALSFTVVPGHNAVKVPMNINGGYFDIAAASMSNGTVAADCEAAFPGTTVTLTVTPNAGYDLKAGTLKYSYDGSDHEPAGSGLIYTFAMPVADVTVKAEFEGVYSISGTITTDNPAGPAAGANVQLKQGGTDVGAAVSTEPDGTYTIPAVPPGTAYTIEVFLTGYITGTISLVDVTGDVTGEDLELVKYVEPVYTISGTITTNNPGGAASGASVQLKQSGSNVGNAVNTAADGTYTITDVPAGTGYTIEVSLTGYTTNTILSFDITSASVTGKDLELVRIVYTVSGTITTNNPGGAANGASVQLKQGAANVGSAVSTDGTGAYTIPNVPAGTYTIEVSLTGYTTGTISSFSAAANVTGKNLELVRIVYTVSGTISTDVPGGAANGASVQLKQGAANVGSAVSTDGTGAYTIPNVPAGTYTIEVSLTGYTTGTISSFSVAANVTGKNLTLAKILVAGDKITYTGDGVSFKMAWVPGGHTFITGVNDYETATVADAYEIGETEVTYELWYKVRSWAVGKGYTFSNSGQEGNAGTSGASPTGADQEPVTVVSWFDAVVWLNALTELVNEETGKSLTLVYYYDSGYSDVAKNSTPTSNFVKESSSHSYASAYAKPEATGFRLPVSNEWELAARWRNDATNTVSGYSDPYFTKGDSASGATARADTSNEAATGAVAWYQNNSLSTTHAVKGKDPNALGLYDMSGNVGEWCFDWATGSTGSSRIVRGGNYSDNSASGLWQGLWVGYMTGFPPDYQYGSNKGFRPARTAQ